MAPAWRLLAVPLTTLLALSACSDAPPSGAQGSAGAAGQDEKAATAGQATSAGVSGSSGSSEGSAGSGRAGSSSRGPEFTAEEWETFRQLAPGALPAARPDVSNRFADDAVAAALGEQLFFDTGFSGKLLDLDNDGSPRSLGVRGQSGKVACAGCHDAENHFLDDRSPFKEITLGAGWTGRRTPSLLDVGQASILMWGGRHSTLHSQVFGALENPLEMNSSRLFLAQFIAANYRAEYEAVFGAGTLSPLADAQRFPVLTADTTGCSLTRAMDHPRAQPPDPLYDCHGFPGDGAEFDGMEKADQDLVTRVVVNAGKAIGAYERLLTCGAGRFDAWVHGDEGALDTSERNGAKLFIGKARCVSCHSGPYFSDQKFYTVGLEEKATRSRIFNGNDRGAALDLPKAAQDPLGINGTYSDDNDGRLSAAANVTTGYEGAFRTPVLRCASKRPSFMHSGLLLSLTDVVAFFNRGGDVAGTYLGSKVLTPLGLTDAEQTDLIAFLRALDGDEPIPTFR